MDRKTKSPRQTGQLPAQVRRFLKGFVLICGFLFFGYAFVVGFADRDDVIPAAAELSVEGQTKDYSRFTHSNGFHSRLPCLLCHRRDDNSARIRFPGKPDHLPCSGCHSLQLSDPTSPICTICHTNSQTGAMKGFPGLRSFGVRFNHSRHRQANCVTCHKPDGGGVSRSIPSGPSAHVTCFQCHTASSGASMASCSTCHQPGRLSRTPEFARSFRVGFSHAKHVGKSTNCTACHTVRAGSGRGQVSAPTASMHFASSRSQNCSSCHNGKRAFGPDDFANCKRCHQGNSFKF